MYFPPVGQKTISIQKGFVFVQPHGILIISPNTLFIEALSHLVQGVGTHVLVTASTVEDGLALLKEQTIDVILVDHIESPQIRWQIMDSLAQQLLTCKIVFFTRHHDQMMVCHCEVVRYTQPDNLIHYILPQTASPQESTIETKEKNELW
jgi:response regulator of citrate/malate metabolism